MGAEHDQREDGRAYLAFGFTVACGRPGDVGYRLCMSGPDEGEGLLFRESAQDIDILVVERTVFAAQALLFEFFQECLSRCASDVATRRPGESDVVGRCQAA